MAYTVENNRIGTQPIAVTDTVANHPLGSVLEAKDPVYGAGEFIYLLGVASTVAGSLVTWNGNSSGTPTFQTALCPSTANLAQPVAVAMSANTAGRYGWYQVYGNAVVSTNGTLAAGPAPIYIGSAGNVTSTGAAGKQILSAVNVTATGTPAANFAVIEINRPHAQGAIT